MLYTQKQPLILASGSPRRRELLAEAGCEFNVLVADIDEEPIPKETAEQMVKRLANGKADAVIAKWGELSSSSWVLAADTTVVLEGAILGKPRDSQDAIEMLSLMQGKQHQVVGGFSLRRVSGGQSIAEVHTSSVTLRSMSHGLIERYVATGEPLDKAGSYAIQGIGGQLVEKVVGSYTNVVGLNMAAVIKALITCQVLEE